MTTALRNASILGSFDLCRAHVLEGPGTLRLDGHHRTRDRGRVEEAGTHDELMQHNGRYAHLFTLQAEGYR